MLATAFAQFAQLPRELRDMVWSAAAAVQYHHIADGSPTSCTAPGAPERLRQAFVGYDNLPQGIERQPLRIYVHENDGTLRLGVNELQTLVNRLPMATVCPEARSHAAEFCRKQIDIVDLQCSMDSIHGGNEIVEHPLQPTTVMVTHANRPDYEPRGFEAFHSADHLVTIIDRMFGSSVEQIILNGCFHSINSMERIYWPHIGKTRDRRMMEYTFIDDTNHNRYNVFMTPDRTVQAKEELLDEYDNAEYDARELARHLLKLHEIMDACKQKQKLPRLRIFEVRQHTYCWDEVLLARIKATAKDGTLWVDWTDIQIGYSHDLFTDEAGW